MNMRAALALCYLAATSALSVQLTPARSARLVMSADVHLTPDLLAADHGVSIAPSPGKGMGAFAAQPWAAGLVVGDYEGEMITKAQFESRYEDEPMTPADEEWLKSRTKRGVSVTGEYIVKVHDDLYVDAEDPDVSSWCRFINHDARPNLALKVLPKGIGGKPRVWFTAKRSVAEGDELCFDYGPGFWDEEKDGVATGFDIAERQGDGVEGEALAPSPWHQERMRQAAAAAAAAPAAAPTAAPAAAPAPPRMSEEEAKAAWVARQAAGAVAAGSRGMAADVVAGTADVKADAVAAGTRSAEEVPAWGAELLELSEACNRGVEYACNALSYEGEAKRAWLANQGEEHVHDDAQGGGGASSSASSSSAAAAAAARAAPVAAGGVGDAAGDAAFEAMGASLVDDLEAAFEEMSAALVDDLQRAFD